MFGPACRTGSRRAFSRVKWRTIVIAVQYLWAQVPGTSAVGRSFDAARISIHNCFGSVTHGAGRAVECNGASTARHTVARKAIA